MRTSYKQGGPDPRGDSDTHRGNHNVGEGLEAGGVHDDNHTQNTDHFTALEQAIPVRETTRADISLSEISNRSSAYLSLFHH